MSVNCVKHRLHADGPAARAVTDCSRCWK